MLYMKLTKKKGMDSSSIFIVVVMVCIVCVVFEYLYEEIDR